MTRNQPMNASLYVKLICHGFLCSTIWSTKLQSKLFGHDQSFRGLFYTFQHPKSAQPHFKYQQRDIHFPTFVTFAKKHSLLVHFHQSLVICWLYLRSLTIDKYKSPVLLQENHLMTSQLGWDKSRPINAAHLKPWMGLSRSFFAWEKAVLPNLTLQILWRHRQSKNFRSDLAYKSFLRTSKHWKSKGAKNDFDFPDSPDFYLISLSGRHGGFKRKVFVTKAMFSTWEYFGLANLTFLLSSDYQFRHFQLLSD